MKTFVVQFNIHGIVHEQSVHLDDMVNQMNDALKVETIIDFISLIDIDCIEKLKPFQVAVLKSKFDSIQELFHSHKTD